MIRYWTTPYSILESMEATLKYAIIKEGCKRGHGLTPSFKQGSLKKSVAAYFIALWCVLSSVLFL